MTGLASPSQLRQSFWRYALVTVPIVLLLGTISGRAGTSGYGNPWFDALIKPEWMPPGWAFGLTWTILYVMLGFALALLLHARGAKGRGLAIALFLAQLALNYSWSPIFFAWHRVGLALWVILTMVALTLVLIVWLARIRRVAAWLLVPYLRWLGFATCLTFEIDRLNPGAEVAPQPVTTDIIL